MTPAGGAVPPAGVQSPLRAAATFVVAFAILFANNGFPLGGLTIFDADMLRETGASIGGLRIRDTITVLTLGLTVPFAGYVLDRFAVKPVLLFGLALMAAALLLYPQVRTLWQIYAVHVLLGLSESTSGVVSCVYLVSNLTDRYRGPALGVLIAGSSLGNALVPAINAWLLTMLPWREAIAAGGWVAVALMPLVVLVIREPAAPREAAAAAPTTTTNDTASPRAVAGRDAAAAGRVPPPGRLGPVLRSRNFLLLALISSLTVFCVLVLTTNLALAFPGQGATLLFALFGTAVLAQVVAGLAAYRWRAGLVHSVTLTLLVAGASTVALGPRAWLTAGVAVFGFGWGANSAMLQVRPTLLFAGPALGRTLAVLAVFETLGGGFGPTIAGYLRDFFGNYSAAFALTVAFSAASFALSLGFRSARRPAAAR